MVSRSTAADATLRCATRWFAATVTADRNFLDLREGPTWIRRTVDPTDVQRLIGVMLAVWVAAAIVVGGLLLAPHLIALPMPTTTDTHLRDAIAARVVGRPGNWVVAHVMYRSCPCSRRTIGHLTTDRRAADLDELVVMVDDAGQAGPEDAALRAAGFQVEVITPDILRERFHVEAAPLLAVARPDHELAYVGGYNRHKQSAAYEDLAIISDLRARSVREALPIYGCATNTRLADAIDPLGIRSW